MEVHRPDTIVDLLEADPLLGERLDLDYVAHWAAELGLLPLWDRANTEAERR